MAKSRDEISHWAEYDYVLVNENLRAVRGGAAARSSPPSGCAATGGPELVELVRRLNAEFEERLG